MNEHLIEQYAKYTDSEEDIVSGIMIIFWLGVVVGFVIGYML